MIPHWPTENTWSDAARRAAAETRRRNRARVGSRVMTPHGKGHISRIDTGLHKDAATWISVVMDKKLKERHYVIPDSEKVYHTIDILKERGGKKWKRKLEKLGRK